MYVCKCSVISYVRINVLYARTGERRYFYTINSLIHLSTLKFIQLNNMSCEYFNDGKNMIIFKKKGKLGITKVIDIFWHQLLQRIFIYRFQVSFINNAYLSQSLVST